MTRVFGTVAALPAEVEAARPGVGIVADADVVMDRGCTVSANPEEIWPWLVQLGKQRAGWYLPRAVERAVPPSRRALRRIDPQWQRLRVGDVIPDYGGRDETFEVVVLDAPTTLVYRSRRGTMNVNWSITVEGRAGPGRRDAVAGGDQSHPPEAATRTRPADVDGPDRRGARGRAHDRRHGGGAAGAADGGRDAGAVSDPYATEQAECADLDVHPRRYAQRVGENRPTSAIDMTYPYDV